MSGDSRHPPGTTKVESAEVLYATGPIVTVDAETIAQLKRDAERNPRRRIRLCTHRGVDDRVHEMLIVHTCDTYVRPHKHVNKSESFHVIEGEVEVVIFADDGAVTDLIPMGERGSGRPFYYRIADPLFHTLLIRSPVLVFHETTVGPFRREETVYAPWAPDDSNVEAVTRFVKRLEEAIARRDQSAGRANR